MPAVYLPSLYWRQQSQISKPSWPSGKRRMSSGRGSHRISLILVFHHEHTFSTSRHVHLEIQSRHKLEADTQRERTHKNYFKCLAFFFLKKWLRVFYTKQEFSLSGANHLDTKNSLIFWTTNKYVILLCTSFFVLPILSLI